MSAGRQERKVVTVLFCDLVGFTQRAEEMDPEDVAALLGPYHARLKEELERYGGTVEKFIGDAVMALFGAPTAHEDDPERAVRAALAIRAFAEEDGIELRIGVTTGEALITLDARPDQGETMATGDVVNTAARLQAGAPVNGILVSEKTYEATKNAIEYEEADPVEAKGKANLCLSGQLYALARASQSTGFTEARSSGVLASSIRSSTRLLVRVWSGNPSSSPSWACPASESRGSSTSSRRQWTAIPSSSPGGKAGVCRTATASPSGRSERSSRRRPVFSRGTPPRWSK